MSELSNINAQYRVAAIKTLMRNRPSLLEKMLDETGQGFNLDATPESVDCDDPEEILIRLAWDIWNGTGETEFDKVLEMLPVEDFTAFVAAMGKFEELRERIFHAYASGSEND